MAQTALPAPRTAPQRKRVLFGLFDADGWPWAIAKSLFWLVTMIMILGYLPDRAYYFTVQKTVDLGLARLVADQLLPARERDAALPGARRAPRCRGTRARRRSTSRRPGRTAPRRILGQAYVFAGGSDGTKAVADTYLTKAVGSGNIDKWAAGPALPEARADAAAVAIGNTLFLIGGYGPGRQGDRARSTA